MIWLMLGHCYLLASQFGNVNVYLKQQLLNQFFTQLIVSSDFALSVFYFMSAFIGMFALIKKYQKPNNNPDIPNTSTEDLNQCKEQVTSSIPRLTKRSLLKQVLARWLRLAIPTYIILIFALTLFSFFGSGPAFPYQNENFLQGPLRQDWWAIVLFI